MLRPVRQTVTLSSGHVVLRAWGATVCEAYLTDLLAVTSTLGDAREFWEDFTDTDVAPAVWPAFWRLVNASLERGSRLPKPLTWNDRLTLLEAMWQLNDLEDAKGKLTALEARVARLHLRCQTMTA